MSQSIPANKSFDENYALGVVDMDDMHQEYLTLFDSLMSRDDADFIAEFEDFIDHVRRHFDGERQLMLDSGFPATPIHHGEHESVLKRLELLMSMAREDQIEGVRNWMRNNLPDWFILHLRIMDSALARHLKASGFSSG